MCLDIVQTDEVKNNMNTTLNGAFILVYVVNKLT